MVPETTAAAIWDSMEGFRRALLEVQARGVSVNLTYGSPVYLAQYLLCHTAIDHEVARIRATGEPDPLIVDWGAGVGHCAFVRRSLGDRVCVHSLSDPNSAPYLPVLKQVCSIADMELRTTADPVVLPFQSEQVDVLVSCGVLEHVHEGGGSVEQSLAEIARVLRPGGAFVCAHLPQHASWIEWVNRAAGRSHHDKRFTLSEVESIASMSGMHAVDLRSAIGLGNQFAGRYGVLPRIQIAKLLQRYGRDTVDVGRRLERLDHLASRLAGPFAQNFIFVLRKADAPPSRP